jgi:hypothetical protein
MDFGGPFHQSSNEKLPVIESLCSTLSVSGVDEEAEAAHRLADSLQLASSSSSSSNLVNLPMACREILAFLGSEKSSCATKVSMQLLSRGRLEPLIRANGGCAAKAFGNKWRVEASMTATAQLFIAFGAAVAGTISSIYPDAEPSVSALVADGPAEVYNLGYLIASCLYRSSPEGSLRAAAHETKVIHFPLEPPRQRRNLIGHLSSTTVGPGKDTALTFDIVIEWDRAAAGAADVVVGGAVKGEDSQTPHEHGGSQTPLENFSAASLKGTRGVWSTPGFRILFTVDRRTVAYMLVEVTTTKALTPHASSSVVCDENNTGSCIAWALRGMKVDDALRGRGLSRTCLLTWLLLCWKLGVTPLTRRIRKPLISLALQSLGFEPANPTAAMALEIVPIEKDALSVDRSEEGLCAGSSKRRIVECSQPTGSNDEVAAEEMHQQRHKKTKVEDGDSKSPQVPDEVLSKNERKRRLKAAALAAKKEAKHLAKQPAVSSTASNQGNGAASDSGMRGMAQTPHLPPSIVLVWAEDRERVLSALSKSEMTKLGLAFADQRPARGGRKVFVNTAFKLPVQEQTNVVEGTDDVSSNEVPDSRNSCCTSSSDNAFAGADSSQPKPWPDSSSQSSRRSAMSTGGSTVTSWDKSFGICAHREDGVVSSLKRELAETFGPIEPLDSTRVVGATAADEDGVSACTTSHATRSDHSEPRSGAASDRKGPAINITLFSSKLLQATAIYF